MFPRERRGRSARLDARRKHQVTMTVAAERSRAGGGAVLTHVARRLDLRTVGIVAALRHLRRPADARTIGAARGRIAVVTRHIGAFVSRRTGFAGKPAAASRLLFAHTEAAAVGAALLRIALVARIVGAGKAVGTWKSGDAAAEGRIRTGLESGATHAVATKGDRTRERAVRAFAARRQHTRTLVIRIALRCFDRLANTAALGEGRIGPTAVGRIVETFETGRARITCRTAAMARPLLLDANSRAWTVGRSRPATVVRIIDADSTRLARLGIVAAGHGRRTRGEVDVADAAVTGRCRAGGGAIGAHRARSAQLRTIGVGRALSALRLAQSRAIRARCVRPAIVVRIIDTGEPRRANETAEAPAKRRLGGRHADAATIGIAVARLAQVARIIDAIEAGLARNAADAATGWSRRARFDGDHTFAVITTRHRATDLSIGAEGAKSIELGAVVAVGALPWRVRRAEARTIDRRTAFAGIVRIVDANVAFFARQAAERAAPGQRGADDTDSTAVGAGRRIAVVGGVIDAVVSLRAGRSDDSAAGQGRLGGRLVLLGLAVGPTTGGVVIRDGVVSASARTVAGSESRDGPGENEQLPVRNHDDLLSASSQLTLVGITNKFCLVKPERDGPAVAVPATFFGEHLSCESASGDEVGSECVILQRPEAPLHRSFEILPTT